MSEKSNSYASGLLLLAVTLIALLWANSPFVESYNYILELSVFGHSLHHWINDGLMVIFFFVVGLEIKKELVMGELSDRRRAALPMVAALGGMIVPALIYFAINRGGVGERGWGIPMATDIAFAVAVLTIFSKKVPFALRIFLLALAIVDDLGAVLVIALFYTHDISMKALALASAGLAAVQLFKLYNIRAYWIYWLVGIFVWWHVLSSGVHATVAGVLLGLMTPARPTQGEAQSPLDVLVHRLHPIVNFVIMPLFALANAGVALGGSSETPVLHHPITLGVLLGLVVGKPLGVAFFSFVAVKLNLASLPKGVRWSHMAAAGLLAGIGFTMALFISNLALKVPELEIYSKSGILLASLIASLAGAVILILLPKQTS